MTDQRDSEGETADPGLFYDQEGEPDLAAPRPPGGPVGAGPEWETAAPALQYPPGARRAHGRRRRRRSHPVLTALAVIVAVVVVIAGAGLIWANGQIDPSGKRGPL
ncbi:MAG TPA: hypothetical protein VKI19_06355, partial [Acidimicrobiales bacterium]|nr:hypothetical protein [Acidimicrobiales bacterium]